MTKPLVLAIALAFAVPSPALAQQAPAGAAQPSSPAWVERSNELAQILVRAQAGFAPEGFSYMGIPGYDEKVSDLGPDVGERFRKAMADARTQLQGKLRLERDPQVRQDLELLVKAADEAAESSRVYETLTLPWTDVAQLEFSGLQSLLSDQVQPERRQHALGRLKAYVGMTEGHVPITEQAMARYTARTGDGTLLRPTKLEVEQALGNSETYVEGIRKLFAKYEIADAGPALDEMERQLDAYADWMRETVLPEARTDTVLPPELYALNLKQVGIDIDPNVLIQRAQLEFMETRAAMQALAPRVVEARGLKVADPGDYVAVIDALKQDVIPNDQLEARYRTVIDAIDPIIRREGIVDVPNRPMVMRLGTEAESAAQPAPHFKPAPLVGNTGQQGQFVLPVTVPTADGEGLAYDDFNFDAVRWTLSAHEGRPGHELQFTAMVERGVSLARSIFAFNSVNVEGWALYAEAEMVPYEPVDGQLIALQFRLLRAARAILDPMLNLGLIDRERAGEVLREKVGLSEAMTKQELDRYTFNAPGQAGSYFYGYSRILELRMATELALGDRFDRLAFNNFLLDQGLLPPDLLADAVNRTFIPAQRSSR
ncbi:DUF885 domain-containing protein [Marilutibacter chinensis]|uniref:DUF885 domain-containing protein n=1 Tax=Marilutibacter chinensis TaxID=2912247 RepID=A0ABS9HVD1_9GAMM|nr:DUF885 domain-containing protein [Lysobacter chinensis]MCF7222846.1 DUF885 domain-containing protein [Lysobacter chinensis]